MAHITVYNNIIFVEENLSEAKEVKPIKTSLGGFGAQLKNLSDVKNNLSEMAKLNNCNCITNFKYGQKAALFAIDDVKFYGSGTASILDPATYEKLLKEANN